MAPSIIPNGAVLHHQRAVDFRDLCVFFSKGLHHRPQPTFTNFNAVEEFQLGRLNTKIHIQYPSISVKIPLNMQVVKLIAALN